MSHVQTLTLPRTTPSKLSEYNALSIQDQWIVDYATMGGLRTHMDGSLQMVDMQTFANSIGYASRQSVYDRQKAIINFGAICNKRRYELAPAIVAATWKGVQLRAYKGDHKQAEMVLTHLGDYELPTQKSEVRHNGFADMIADAMSQGAITQDDIDMDEGEIIDGNVTAIAAPEDSAC